MLFHFILPHTHSPVAQLPALGIAEQCLQTCLGCHLGSAALCELPHLDFLAEADFLNISFLGRCIYQATVLKSCSVCIYKGRVQMYWRNQGYLAAKSNPLMGQKFKKQIFPEPQWLVLCLGIRWDNLLSGQYSSV